MNRITIVIVLTLGLVSCGGGSRFEDPGSLRSAEEVSSYLRTLVGDPDGPPSISVAVGIGDSLVYVEAFGLADIENEVPATPQTPYRVYSVSKGITAVAVLQLLEDGAVSLDDNLREFIPQFPEKPWPLTIRHLLTHTSGIRHYRENAGEISSVTEYPTLTASLEVFKDDPLEFEPGTDFGYTSFGFNLLTGVVEAASGMTFERYLSEKILSPAGMDHSGLDVQGRDLGEAKGYWPSGRFSSRRPIDPLPNVSGRYGSSGMLSTPSDLVRMFIALNQGVLMAAETRDLMWAVPYPDVAPTQALGWNVSDDEDGTVYRTGGGTGFMSIVAYKPQSQVTAALVTNLNQWEGRVVVLNRIIESFVDSGEP